MESKKVEAEAKREKRIAVRNALVESCRMILDQMLLRIEEKYSTEGKDQRYIYTHADRFLYLDVIVNIFWSL